MPKSNEQKNLKNLSEEERRRRQEYEDIFANQTRFAQLSDQKKKEMILDFILLQGKLHEDYTPDKEQAMRQELEGSREYVDRAVDLLVQNIKTGSIVREQLEMDGYIQSMAFSETLFHNDIRGNVNKKEDLENFESVLHDELIPEDQKERKESALPKEEVKPSQKVKSSQKAAPVAKKQNKISGQGNAQMLSFGELMQIHPAEYPSLADKVLENGALAGDFIQMTDQQREAAVKEYIFLRARIKEGFKRDELVTLYEQLNTPGSQLDRIAKAFSTRNVRDAFARGSELQSEYFKDIVFRSVKDGIPRASDREINAYVKEIQSSDEGLKNIRQRRAQSGRKIPERKQTSYKIFTNEEVNALVKENEKALKIRKAIPDLNKKYETFNRKLLTEIDKLIRDSEERNRNNDPHISETYNDLVNAAKAYKEGLQKGETMMALNGKLQTLNYMAEAYTLDHKGLTKGNGIKGRMRYNASSKIESLIDRDYSNFKDEYLKVFDNRFTLEEVSYEQKTKDALEKSEVAFAKGRAMQTVNKHYDETMKRVKAACTLELRNEHGNVEKLPEEEFLARQREAITNIAAWAIVTYANQEKAREYIGHTDQNSIQNSTELAKQVFSENVMRTLAGDLKQRDAFKSMIANNTKSMEDITKLGNMIKKGNLMHCYLELNKEQSKIDAKRNQERVMKKSALKAPVKGGPA